MVQAKKRCIVVECENGLLKNKKTVFPQSILDLIPSDYSGHIHFFAIPQEKKAALDSLLAKAQEWKRIQDSLEERVGFRGIAARKDDDLYEAIVVMQSYLIDKLF